MVLNEPGSSSTSPSRLPRIFVENQPSRPSMRALNAGAKTVFISVCPVLKSFPQIATLCSCASSCMAGKSTVRFGAPLANGHAAGNRRPRVQHRRRNRRMIRLHRFDKFLRGRVHVLLLQKNLGRPAPAGHQPRNLAGLLEIRDVFLDLQRQFVLVLAFFDVRTVQLLHILVIKRRLHRLDRRKKRLHLLQILRVQHAGIARRLKRVVLVNVPTRKNQIIQPAQWHKLLDLAAIARQSACPAGSSPSASATPPDVDLPLRTSSTPAINVVLTAPIPGSKTPKFSLRWRNLRWLFHSSPSVQE